MSYFNVSLKRSLLNWKLLRLRSGETMSKAKTRYLNKKQSSLCLRYEQYQRGNKYYTIYMQASRTSRASSPFHVSTKMSLLLCVDVCGLPDGDVGGKGFWVKFAPRNPRDGPA